MSDYELQQCHQRKRHTAKANIKKRTRQQDQCNLYLITEKNIFFFLEIRPTREKIFFRTLVTQTHLLVFPFGILVNSTLN